ncbi:Aldehyde dehydrogenase, mitochondrial [Halotydeus destructor]|nr:Aldehyde dehydrogenase, mitochondrial [Halotydeus destructor]
MSFTFSLIRTLEVHSNRAITQIMSLPAPIREPEVKYTQIFINNEWHDSESGKTFATINPVTGETIAEVQEGDQADVEAAILAARESFEFGSTWRTMDASKRGHLLYELSKLIERDIAYLASLETVDNGKPFTISLMDIQQSIKVLRYYSGWCDKIHGKTVPTEGDFIAMTRVEPVGVCGLIIPWNFPILSTIAKLAPSLACGCTIVIKPAEQTPLTALAVAALVQEAGFPPGVVNVVPGYGPTAGAALTESPLVDKISFTGSTEVGQLIQQVAGKNNIKRVTLELGGKSPLVVCDDADLEEAVQVAQFAVFFNQGQFCIAGSRTFVQEGIYDAFVERARDVAAERVLGDPFDPTTVQGPQVDEEQFNRIMGLIESGIAEGAKLECGGGRHGDQGYFVQPTIFSQVTDNMTIAREEIFGPVMQIFKFTTLDEVIDRANDTRYGLAAGILTKNIDSALMFAQAVQAGAVWVNCYLGGGPGYPFGGYKMSVWCWPENGQDGLSAYCEIKSIVIKVNQKNS